MSERVDRITEPLVEGRFYLVPTIHYEWFKTIRNWPVIGPEHNDADRFHFTAEHYHIDARFLGRKHPNRESAFRAPLHAFPYGSGVLPSPIFRPMRCYSSYVRYPHGDREEIRTLRSDFAGVQCAIGKGGWICPHRKASLGNVLPIDGVITCPLHGLPIDAATGRVLE